MAIFAELEVSQRKSPQMSNAAATKGVVSKSLYECKSYLTEVPRPARLLPPSEHRRRRRS